MFKLFSYYLFLISPLPVFAADTGVAPHSVETSELIKFKSNPSKVKKIIGLGLGLTKQNLTYKYGSSNPNQGGMDCSGTIYYLLTQMGIQPTSRSSNDLYNWVRKKGVFYSANSGFNHLHPGDLLFWTGTYSAPNNSYITHVMLYIGKNTKGETLMLGSSNGRTYQGKKIYGVSVFDFLEPTTNRNNKFVGYSCIPGLSC